MARILLIGKDAGLRSNWKELLTFLGHKVNDKESLEGINSISELTTRYFTGIDVVVADTDVVGLDGLKLKALFNNDFQRIPIVFVSADHVPKYSLDRDELSAISFLRMPFDNASLLEYVNKALKIQEIFNSDSDSNKTIARLLVKQPGKLPLDLALRRSYTFGRFRDSDEFHADIQLTSPLASRKHAYLIRVFKENQSFYKLIDFSTNGILINGKKMEKVQKLNQSDAIELYPNCHATFYELDRNSNDLDTTLTQGE